MQITSSRLRKKGYRQALLDAALEPDEFPALPGLYSSDSGHRRTLELMQISAEPPTALFCANDEIAAGAMAALSEMGLRVPEDVSVIGFDDSSAASVLRPALTTLRQPFQELARRAVELLLAQVQDHETAVQQILLPTSLIVRDTVSAPHLPLSSTLNFRVQKGPHA